ncbi:MAG: glycosyltransferase family 4 protein [Promethearchaeota archaeon]
MTPKKGNSICQITPFLYPYPGGQEVHTYMLSRSLARIGWKVSIVTTNFPVGKTYEKVDGIEIYRTRMILNPIDNPITPSMLPILQKIDADVFHAHSYWNFSTNVACFVSKLKKIPFIITSHGYQPFRYFVGKFLRTFYLKTIGGYTLSNLDKMVLYHPQDKNILMSLGIPEKKIEIIPNAVSLDEFNPIIDGTDILETYDLNKSKRILFVGRLIKRKGCRFIIKAMPEILRTFPDAKLIVVGNGPQEAQLKNLVKKLGIADSVLFLGYIPPLGETLNKIYAISDVLVLPSLDECMSRVILEAMSMRKPIVTTDAWYSKWLVQPGEIAAILVNPKETEQLANAVIRVLQDSTLAMNLATKGRQLIEDRYNWEKIAKQLTKIYGKCIEEKRQQLTL